MESCPMNFMIFFKNETEDLIETLAYKMTKFIFDNYEMAETVDLTIKNPGPQLTFPRYSIGSLQEEEKGLLYWDWDKPWR